MELNESFTTLIKQRPVLSLLSLMLNGHSQKLELLLQHHFIRVSQTEVCRYGSPHVQLLRHEVQDGLLLVEGSVTFVNVQDKTPIAGPSRGVNT